MKATEILMREHQLILRVLDNLSIVKNDKTTDFSLNFHGKNKKEKPRIKTTKKNNYIAPRGEGVAFAKSYDTSGWNLILKTKGTTKNHGKKEGSLRERKESPLPRLWRIL